MKVNSICLCKESEAAWANIHAFLRLTIYVSHIVTRFDTEIINSKLVYGSSLRIDVVEYRFQVYIDLWLFIEKQSELSIIQ